MENQIESVIKSAISNIQNLVDVNTVIGKPYTTLDGNIIVPISKVTLGVLAGGGEYSEGNDKKKDFRRTDLPMAGGTGAYIQLNPIGFLVNDGNGIKSLPLNTGSPYEKIFEAATEFFAKKGKKKDN